jgi:CheY-like chemotaxis protein
MEAIRKLADNPDVAILFTDVVMPGINGRQLALLARESSPRIKVLFTTGYELDDLGPDSLGRTDELILRKPFEVNQLAQALNCLQAE